MKWTVFMMMVVAKAIMVTMITVMILYLFVLKLRTVHCNSIYTSYLHVCLLSFTQDFEDSMAQKQPDIDRLTKAHKRRRSQDSPSALPQLDRSRRGKGSRPRSRDPSPGSDSRNPRVAALHNKWKQVWLVAMDRRRRLQDALDRQAQVKGMIYVCQSAWVMAIC